MKVLDSLLGSLARRCMTLRQLQLRRRGLELLPWLNVLSDLFRR